MTYLLQYVCPSIVGSGGVLIDIDYLTEIDSTNSEGCKTEYEY
jgi:hypothetical protein